MNILVTGGAGYIGSHTLVDLLDAGHGAVCVDDLSNSSEEAVIRAGKIAGKDIPFYKADIRDRSALDMIFTENDIDCVIHFAGFKAVGESMIKPWEYYENNLMGTLTLTDVMRRHGCKRLIFSSTSTVYGDPEILPIREDAPKGNCANAYARTKWFQEEILRDLCAADLRNGDPDPWGIVILRYFNPIGAHPSGLIGEDPRGIPNGLMPYITQVAVGRLEKLTVFGSDYNTPDGTGIRDYIHVCDLASGHVAVLSALKAGSVIDYNLGTGRGYTVLEIVRAFEAANGIEIPYVYGPRRAGDIAAYWSDPSKIERELGWKAEKGLEDMCRDSWNWQKKNPEGYGR